MLVRILAQDEEKDPREESYQIVGQRGGCVVEWAGDRLRERA